MSYGLLFDAMGSPVRREILERLAAESLSVRELSEHFPMSRPAMSQHLKVLKTAELVVVEQQGTRRLYRVNWDAVARMRAYLDRFWDLNLAAFKQAVEQDDT